MLSNLSGKFMEKFRKFSKYGFVGGSGAEPRRFENIKKLIEKSMETCKILKVFMHF